MRSTARSYLRQPLNFVFAQPSAVRVLRELARHGGALPIALLVDRTKLTRPSVAGAVRELTASGLVETLGHAHRLYRFDPEHPLAPALVELFNSEERRFHNILDALRSAATDVGAAAVWLYGSVARDQDHADSDLDVVFVLNDDKSGLVGEDLREILSHAEASLRFSASVIVLEPAAIRRLIATDDPWWRRMSADASAIQGTDPLTLAAGVFEGYELPL